jgi:transposase
MSIIHTCELNKVSPFDYLTELLRHPAKIIVRPGEWMPWNYRTTLAGTATPRPPDLLI